MSNTGTGGPNGYDMPREHYALVVADATAWAEGQRLLGEGEEYLVSTFCNEAIEYGRYRELAKKNAKAGKPVTVIFLDEPEWFPTGEEGDDTTTVRDRRPDYYAKTSSLGVATAEQAAAALARYRPAASVVLTVTQG